MTFHHFSHELVAGTVVCAHVHVCDGKEWMANTPLTKQAWKDNSRINGTAPTCCKRKDTSSPTVSWCFIRLQSGTGIQLPHKISFCEKPTNQINTKPLKQGGMRVSVVISVFLITGGKKHRFALWGTQFSQMEIWVGLKVQAHSCSCYISRQIQMCRGQNHLPSLTGDKRHSRSSHPD